MDFTQRSVFLNSDHVQQAEIERAQAAQAPQAPQAPLGTTPTPLRVRTTDPATQALRAKQPHIYAVGPDGHENVAMIMPNPDGTYQVMMPRQGMHDPKEVFDPGRGAGCSATPSRKMGGRYRLIRRLFPVPEE
jgi:hypothetical protein